MSFLPRKNPKDLIFLLSSGIPVVLLSLQGIYSKMFPDIFSSTYITSVTQNDIHHFYSLFNNTLNLFIQRCWHPYSHRQEAFKQYVLITSGMSQVYALSGLTGSAHLKAAAISFVGEFCCVAVNLCMCVQVHISIHGCKTWITIRRGGRHFVYCTFLK